MYWVFLTLPGPHDVNHTHLHNWHYWHVCRGGALSGRTQTPRASARIYVMGEDRMAAGLRFHWTYLYWQQIQ